MKDDSKLVIDSSQVWVAAHLFIALGLIAAAGIFYRKDVFLGGLFATVSGLNIILSFLARRLKVTLDGDTIEVQDYIIKKSMNIQRLVSAGVGGNAIYMRNDQGQNLSIPRKFLKKDMTLMLARLQPYIMMPTVKRDTQIEKFIKKYIS